LHLARDAVLPIATALILGLVFLRAVRAMQRRRIPPAIGAALVVLGLIASFLAGAYYLAEPARRWLDEAPRGLRDIGLRLRHITGQMRNVTDATTQVRDMAQDMTASGEGPLREVTMKPPALSGRIFAAAAGFAVSAINTLVLLYFLLACGDRFLEKAAAATPLPADKERLIATASGIEAAVSRYVLSAALVSALLGGAVALALVLFGVPNPVLWSVLVGALNFVPCLGAIASVGILTLVGLLAFDEPWRALLVPASFCLLAAAERQWVMPLIRGYDLGLNTVIVVLAVVFWWAMWGVAGAVLAVPMLVALKAAADRVERLGTLGKFLSA
jgi:predicted PurR-regulated permease PerM